MSVWVQVRPQAPEFTVRGLAEASLSPTTLPAASSAMSEGCWCASQQSLSPLTPWVSPSLLDIFPMHPSCLTVLAQFRVKDFCPLKFSSGDRNPQWGVRGVGWAVSLQESFLEKQMGLNPSEMIALFIPSL